MTEAQKGKQGWQGRCNEQVLFKKCVGAILPCIISVWPSQMGNTQRRREGGRRCEKPEEVNKLQAAEFLRQRGDGKGTVQSSILCTGEGGKNLCRDMCKWISRCPFGITSSSLTKPFTPHQLARPPSRLNTREEPACGRATLYNQMNQLVKLLLGCAPFQPAGKKSVSATLYNSLSAQGVYPSTTRNCETLWSVTAFLKSHLQFKGSFAKDQYSKNIAGFFLKKNNSC